MKKIFTVLACFALVSMTATAQLAQITLMHDGNATMFNANQTAAALEASADGDVLYFTEGSYTGGVTITKRVSLVGVGEGTVINGDLTINLGESSAAMPAHMLDALQLTGSITLRSNTNGLKLRKVKFDSFKYINTTTIATTNCTIDRCFINGTMNLSQKVEGMTIISSKIKFLQGMAATASSATIINCNIYTITNSTSANKLLATVMNSILYGSSSSSWIHKDCVFINCLYRNDYGIQGVVEGGTPTNCWMSSMASLNTSTLECTTDDETLVGEGFVGTDGTVVGIHGGVAPFTLVPSAPRITESVIKVDPENKQLNVNLKVVAN